LFSTQPLSRDHRGIGLRCFGCPSVQKLELRRRRFRELEHAIRHGPVRWWDRLQALRGAASSGWPPDALGDKAEARPAEWLAGRIAAARTFGSDPPATP
jgi:hypothetical protein